MALDMQVITEATNELDDINSKIDSCRRKLERNWEMPSLQSISEIEESDLSQSIRDFFSSGIGAIDRFISLIETFGKKSALLETGVELVGLNDGWKQLKAAAERMQRKVNLLVPRDRATFESDLRWMVARGEREDLPLIRRIERNPPYSSKTVEILIEEAQRRISQRFPQVEGRLMHYKILCSRMELENQYEEVSILEEYQAFVVVSASEAQIQHISQMYLVDPIDKDNIEESLEETALSHSGEAAMTGSDRDKVVRFKFPIKASWQEAIEALGAEILSPLGGFEIAVMASQPDLVSQIEALDYVEQVTPYFPRIQVQMEYLERSESPTVVSGLGDSSEARPRRLRVTETAIPVPGLLIAEFFTVADRNAARNALASTEDIEVVSACGETELILQLSEEANVTECLTLIKQLVGLRSLSEETIPEPFNDRARTVVLEGSEDSSLGLSVAGIEGEGETIAIADSGLDNGELNRLHLDIRERVLAIKSYPVADRFKSVVTNVGADDGPIDRTGHGTHVVGTALGNGQQAEALKLSCVPVGIAPEASLIFQSIEQPAKWTDAYIARCQQKERNPEPYYYLGVPADLATLFEFAYKQKARIYSISWGSLLNQGDVDRRARQLNDFVWKNKDFLVVVAAGNGGKHASAAEFIDAKSICSPGTAKNCITVGASENDRAHQYPEIFPETYRDCSPSRFSKAPFCDDGLVDSVEDIAAFSGRGPCQGQEERCKPDIVVPGTLILSTRSSETDAAVAMETSYPPAPQQYAYRNGTSMAAPMVAGCAALVRQYLRKRHKPVIIEPTAALVKAALIHAAQYVPYRYAHPSSRRYMDNEQGWGRINLAKFINLAQSKRVRFIDEARGLVTGENRIYSIEVEDESAPLKVTLVHTDSPKYEFLVNNLNLIVHSPGGKRFIGNDFDDLKIFDRVNNVEGVVVESPERGLWRVEVMADNIKDGVQDYALVISGGLSASSTVE